MMMRYANLVNGLSRSGSGVALCFAAGPHGFLMPVALVAMGYLCWTGGVMVAESLFGERGLVCDILRAGDARNVRVERAKPVATRLRITNPSPALRARGQVARFRGRSAAK